MNIKCGHCNHTHPSVADVRACAEHEQGRSFIGDAPVAMPSPRQLDYAHALLSQREPYGAFLDAEKTNGPDAAHDMVSALTRAEIGEFISKMKGRLQRQQKQRLSTQPRAEEGMYSTPEGVFKVQRAVNGSGHLYAKQLVDGVFILAPGRVNNLLPTQRMTKAQAVEYGRLYGTCVRCGRTLTDEDSIAAGIGPVCASKEGWA